MKTVLFSTKPYDRDAGRCVRPPPDVPDVLITGHQALFTAEALHNIADCTLGNISAFARGERGVNEVAPGHAP